MTDMIGAGDIIDMGTIKCLWYGMGDVRFQDDTPQYVPIK